LTEWIALWQKHTNPTEIFHVCLGNKWLPVPEGLTVIKTSTNLTQCYFPIGWDVTANDKCFWK
jgi:hypothetical protein